MKFEIYVGERAPREWVWELSYEERRPGLSRPTTHKSVGQTYPTADEAKRAAETEADAIARRHARAVTYTYESVGRVTGPREATEGEAR